MRRARRIAVPLLVAAMCAGLAEASPAQGGWRRWEVHLHDGRRLEANPLGAPDESHLSLSVAAYEGRERRVARKLVHVIAALPRPDTMPVLPAAAPCEDVIVRRDGKTTAGRISLAHVRWSDGVVTQHGDSVDLRDVAYLIFAARGATSIACRREAPRDAPDFINRCVLYPADVPERPRLCAEDSRT
ncbi:MAG TPA: hypothetical protein VFZ21_08555 [Gemmatimonadaceae bacterium]|jgi:hypothetical protein|nr:hypothetical protein [Gemmatimonadaceae bacterium]